MKILHLDASPRIGESVSRQLSLATVQNLKASNPTAEVIRRDLTESSLPFVDAETIGAYYTPPADLNERQKEILTPSNDLVEELLSADVIVLGAPMWNFGVPAALKAWIDLVTRVGVTFRYTENGPEGLLKNKRVIFNVTTGGTPIGSDWDHLTPHLKTFFAFLGITEQTLIGADAMNTPSAEQNLARALSEVESLATVAA